jgi:hypothetical protein
MPSSENIPKMARIINRINNGIYASSFFPIDHDVKWPLYWAVIKCGFKLSPLYEEGYEGDSISSRRRYG